MPNYRDLNLAFTKHPVTSDVTTLTDVAAIKRSLKNLMMTDSFEAPFDPNKGSGLKGLLFENYDPFTISALKRKIQELVERYEPRVVLEQVRVHAEPDKNNLQVVLAFYVNPYRTLETIEVILERTR